MDFLRFQTAVQVILSLLIVSYTIYIYLSVYCASRSTRSYTCCTRGYCLIDDCVCRSRIFCTFTHVFRTNIFNLHRQIATVPLSANFESQSYYAEWCTVKKNDAIASSSNRQSQKQHLVILLCNYCWASITYNKVYRHRHAFSLLKNVYIRANVL